MSYRPGIVEVADLVEYGLTSGELSRVGEDGNYPFRHTLVPDRFMTSAPDPSIGAFGTHQTWDLFPKEWLPEHVEVVSSPVFGVDVATGNVLPYETDWDLQQDFVTKKVWTHKVLDRLKDYKTPLHTDTQAAAAYREEMIRLALKRFVEMDLRYLMSITESRLVVMGSLMNKVTMAVRGAR